jgi:hypothetical protein
VIKKKACPTCDDTRKNASSKKPDMHVPRDLSNANEEQEEEEESWSYVQSHLFAAITSLWYSDAPAGFEMASMKGKDAGRLPPASEMGYNTTLVCDDGEGPGVEEWKEFAGATSDDVSPAPSFMGTTYWLQMHRGIKQASSHPRSTTYAIDCFLNLPPNSRQIIFVVEQETLRRLRYNHDGFILTSNKFSCYVDFATCDVSVG